ncbi:diadenosine tetraphosphate (Ap4A) HIT family hydrolase [Trinickia symbiotica]|uniref:HIT family protein n=1 Tax=Trinickia symbiotica TaxID=863227 RepID=A0A2N7X492_9BURK|nr:HIT family protein [Trinickia symbiotica]PMS36372.1 HIT family protein [Trinickia symbiotica]PPK44813.1 diadenosine tetraphosphate (Ap4A) HIT family hydrolase [Trinickia symbiotica]
MDCAFCRDEGGVVLWQDDAMRVVLADEHDYPGFCRVIWNRHVSEFSDLVAAERDRLMRVVYAVERAQRQVLQPVKVNLASLGNQVPHVHWHVIPRFSNDAHFPLPVWAPRQRGVSEALLSSRRAQATLLGDAVRREIAGALA